MKRPSPTTSLAAALLFAGATASADFTPEPLGQIESLPAEYPDHWAMVHDFSFFHMFEGEVVVVDPLATTVADQYKGMMTASFIAKPFAQEPGNGLHTHFSVVDADGRNVFQQHPNILQSAVAGCLRAMAGLGLVRDLRPVPARLLADARRRTS